MGDLALKNVWPFLYSIARKKKSSVETMLQNYSERQLKIFSVSLDHLNFFHSSYELHDFIMTMGSVRLQLGSDKVEWVLTSNRKFYVKSCYSFLNDGGLRSKYLEDIWKAVIPLKVKVFAWLATHYKTLSKERLGWREWNGSQNCEICRLNVEINTHIFLHCPFAISIWEFFLSGTACILDTHIADVFSLFQFSKFNITRQCWCILVLSILWSVWLNRNVVIFRNMTSNLASIFFFKSFTLLQCG